MNRQTKQYRISVPNLADTDESAEELPKDLPSAKNSQKQILKDYGFGQEFNKNTRSSKICLADFFGSQKNKNQFLKLAGYLQTYSKLKEEGQKSNAFSDRRLVKPENPYIMDLNAKRRAVLKDQKITLSPLANLAGSKSNTSSPRTSECLTPTFDSRSYQNSPKSSMQLNSTELGLALLNNSSLEIPEKFKIGKNSDLDELQRILQK